MYCDKCGSESRNDANFCFKCGQELSHVRREQYAAGSVTATEETSPEAVRRILSGRYEVEGLVGRGGMGVVYQAYDHQLGMEVAIKFLLERFADDLDAMESLKREAKAAMRLSHPNIVRLYNFEDTPEAKYLLMEFIRGESLAAIAAKRPGGCFTEQEVARYISEVCGALQYAHDENVIHRDIKPGNIIVTAEGRVKLADFGVAFVKMRAADTTEGQIGGTLTYMSPEQILGRSLDGRTDIYSLGVTMYQMLAGVPPFQGKEVSLQHIHAIPKAVEGVSAWMNSVVLKCLRKEPEGRWLSAAELKDVLTGKKEIDVAMQSKYQPWWVRAEAENRSSATADPSDSDKIPERADSPPRKSFSVQRTAKTTYPSRVRQRVDRIGRHSGLFEHSPEREHARMGFGALAGVAGGLIIALIGWSVTGSSSDFALFRWSWLIYGGLIGGAIGVAQKRTAKGMLSFTSGMTGGLVAALLLNPSHGTPALGIQALASFEPFYYGVLCGAMVGAFLGVADGVYERSPPYLLRCLLWGGAGGAVGGAVFWLAHYILSTVWPPLLNWMLIGAALGFFINMGVSFAERPWTEQMDRKRRAL